MVTGMTSIARYAATSALLLLLGACGESDSAPGPGGVTVGEARALDEAAEMIEARRIPPETSQATAVPSAEPTAEPQR